MGLEASRAEGILGRLRAGREEKTQRGASRQRRSASPSFRSADSPFSTGCAGLVVGAESPAGEAETRAPSRTIQEGFPPSWRSVRTPVEASKESSTCWREHRRESPRPEFRPNTSGMDDGRDRVDSQLVEGDAGGREGVVVEVGRSVEPDEDAWESVPDAKSIPFNTPSNNGDPADM